MGSTRLEQGGSGDQGVGTTNPAHTARRGGKGIRPAPVNPPKIPELAEGFYCPARARAPSGHGPRGANRPAKYFLLFLLFLRYNDR